MAFVWDGLGLCHTGEQKKPPATFCSDISLGVHDKSQPLEKGEEKVHLENDVTLSLQTCALVPSGCDPVTMVLLSCTG